MKNIIIIIILIILILFLLLQENIYQVINLSKQIKNDKKSYLIGKIFENNKYTTLYEGIFISPQNPLLLKLIKNVYDDFKHIFIKDIDNYVSFSRLNLTLNDRINCDWCSIVNGMIKLIIDSIIELKDKNIKQLQNINLYNSYILLNYIKIGTIFRNKTINNTTFIKNTFNNYNKDIDNLIKVISNLYLIGEQIELRWCPFKSMTNYYRHTDKRYIPINKETIYKAGEILSKYNTIECHFCNKVINEEMDKKYISQYNDSPMLEYYEYLKK